MVGRLVDFEQLHVLAADDRDDDALGPGHAHAVEQRVGDRVLGRFERAVVALAFASAHHRLAHLAHHRTHVREVEIDQARHNHQVGDRAHALLQHFVGELERFLEGGFRLGDQEQVLVGNDDQRVDMLLQLVDARFGRAHAARPFEQERLGYHAHGEHAALARRLGDDRGRTGAGAAAHARRDEHHVHPVERVLDILHGFLGCGLAHFGAGACAEPAGDIRTELDALFGRGRAERLRIGVGDDEIDAFDLRFHHVGDGVAARTADADDHDLGTKIVVRCRSDIDTHQESPGYSKVTCWLYVTTLAQSESQIEAAPALSTRPKGGIRLRIKPQKYSRTA